MQLKYNLVVKKIINNPGNFVEESLDGLIKSHPDVYALSKDNNRVITRAKKSSNKVGIVTGGGIDILQFLPIVLVRIFRLFSKL